ncbi:MAG: thiamine-phosphate kinase [Bacteroidota bacterium]
MPDFTPIAGVGEFGLIERLRDALGAAPADDLVVGIGDDAAVMRIGNGRVQVVTTDTLVEGVHFDRSFMSMGLLGAKAIAVNVSDVAAMNAAPRWATVALGLPNNVSVEAVETLYDGIAHACKQYGCTVVGGDVTASERFLVSVTVIGEAGEDAVVLRSGAQPGDLLCVTGDLGSAAAGLKVLLAEKDAFAADDAQPDLSAWSYVVERHLAPRARLDRLAQWREAGVRPHALVDISDGLASEVHHVCRASGVGARLEAALLPVHAQTFKAAERFGDRPETYALYGGEDYELLFALPEAHAKKLPGDSFAVVGAVTASPEVVIGMPDGATVPLEATGFRHF